MLLSGDLFLAQKMSVIIFLEKKNITRLSQNWNCVPNFVLCRVRKLVPSNEQTFGTWFLHKPLSISVE